MNERAEDSAPLAGGGWQQALDALERSLLQAVQAIGLLRVTLAGVAPAATPIPAPPASSTNGEHGASATPVADAVEAALTPVGELEHRTRSTFERLWDRIELERRERDEQGANGAAGPERRGLDLLPQQFLMTVEDREGKVDLIPLHRALLGVVPMEDVALLSFGNGVPVISLRIVGELNLERLGNAVADAMDRQCEVIPQDNGRLYLRLKAREGQEA